MNEYDLSRLLTLRECREQDRAALAGGPIGYAADGTPFFLRYDDVLALLVHPHSTPGGTMMLERQGITSGLLHEWFQNFFGLLEPPEHTRMRAVVSRTFAVRPIERMRAVARAEADAALDSLEPGRPFDVFEEFAVRVPMRVICTVLGIEDLDLVALYRAISDLGRALVALSLSPDERENGERAIRALYGPIGEVLEKKRAQPGDDVVSLLAAAERAGELTRAQSLAMVSGLMFAGIDTTKTLIGLELYLTTTRPELLEQLRRKPELAAPAVEEIFRHSPPVPWIARFASERMEHAGVVLERGDPIMLALSTANLDQDVDEPERFDITREPTAHLGLGRGRHFCLGAALARLEGQEMLLALARRGLPLEVVGDEPRWLRADQLIRPSEPLRLRVHTE